MTPWVLRILIATVLMFFVQQTVPGATSLLYLVPTQVLARPWTLVTYMFLHAGFGHIFWNMLGLYFFGVVGALFSVLLAPLNPILGASGAVLGVLMAFARFWPRERLYIWGVLPIEARWLVIIYAAIDIMGFNGFGRLGVANVAHLGEYHDHFVSAITEAFADGVKTFDYMSAALTSAANAYDGADNTAAESTDHLRNRLPR